MGVAFAARDRAVFQGASEAAIPFMGLARASNAERRPDPLQPFGLHRNEAGGCVGFSVTAPRGGCAFEAALPAEEEEGNGGGWRVGELAPFRCNKGRPH